MPLLPERFDLPRSEGVRDAPGSARRKSITTARTISMSVLFNPPRARPLVPESLSQAGIEPHRRGFLLPALCAVAILILAGPPFLRMPLTNDAALFDLQARLLRDGGVLYRDILEPNLPGVVWLHVLVRSLFGESSEVLRLFDLAVFGGIVALAAGLLRRAGAPARAGGWFALLALLFYLSISEWCHCQRDMWMLLPALGALTMRARQTSRRLESVDAAPAAGLFGWSLLEGLLWGAGVWIKPYVALPGLAVWVVSQRLVRRPKYLLFDTGGLLAGGLLAGALGVAWLVHAGAGEAFTATLTDWNPRYFQAGRENWTRARLIAMEVRLWPWALLHLVAAPLALKALWRSMRRPGIGIAPLIDASVTPPLLASFYLAWCAQAFCLQHLFDYVHAPPLLLALLVATSQLCADPQRHPRPLIRLAAMSFAVLAIIASPLLRSDRLQAWPQCVSGPNSPRLQDRLAHFDNPDREDLARIAEFLRRSAVHDRDVCFYNSDFVSMYQALGLRPPTRYVYVCELLVFFPERSREIEDALQQSGHRFVVTDLVSCGLPRALAEEIGPDGPLAPPPAYQRMATGSYPWSLPVVYRAGTYLVHRVDSSVAETARHH